MVNFGPLTAEIRSGVWGTPANFNRFHVLAALLHGTIVVSINQTAALNRWRQLCSVGRPSRWALARILVLTGSGEALVTHTRAQTTALRPLFRDYLGEPVPEEIFFWTFMVQWNIREADTPTIRVGATPSRVIRDHLHHRPIFMPDALPNTTLPLYPGLGQAPNMLACIPRSIS